VKNKADGVESEHQTVDLAESVHHRLVSVVTPVGLQLLHPFQQLLLTAELQLLGDCLVAVVSVGHKAELDAGVRVLFAVVVCNLGYSESHALQERDHRGSIVDAEDNVERVRVFLQLFHLFLKYLLLLQKLLTFFVGLAGHEAVVHLAELLPYVLVLPQHDVDLLSGV
jgi:hypothetical protein